MSFYSEKEDSLRPCYF